SEGATTGKLTYDSAGADLTEDGFVRVVFAGGPGIKAGLRRGDRVIAVDGKPFHRVASFRGKAGQEVKLQVLRNERQQPCEMRLTPRRISPKEEWLSAQRIGSCLMAHEKTKTKILYLPMYSCARREFADLLRDTLMEKGSEADGLVLDLRNGWGGCNPELVQLFQGNPPVLTYVGRDGTQRKIDSRWRKPLVVLINQGSRSGKEVVASSIKKHKLGVLVGKTTAGAVVGGRPFFLQGEAILYLAVQDVRVDGVRLEGVGVAPDVEVADQLEYGEGRDPQLQKALELAGMPLAR
ncbi:MAG: S41 family peptidase, partial [Gemmataceae bacterium]